MAARVVRRSLKEDKRLQAERRGEMDLRFAKWEVSRTLVFQIQRLGVVADRVLVMQNGKQGENKSLGEANAMAMANAAGQEAK